MPRKRKARNASTRATPKVPDGDEGADLETELKKEKLATLLKDYDTQMKSFYKEIKENLSDYGRSLQCIYTVEINRTPKMIRDMYLDDYLNAGGDLTSIQLLGSDQVTQDITNDIENDMGLATLTKSKKKKKKTLPKPMEGIEEDCGTITKGLKAKGRKKAIMQTASGTGDAVNMPPPSTARPRRTRQKEPFATPAQFGGPGVSGWETPLITPKFDPRLPITPAMSRQPKHGELLISLAGSPVAQGDTVKKNHKASKNYVVVGDMEIDIENIQIPDYSLATKNYLKQLKDKLSQMPLSPMTE